MSHTYQPGDRVLYIRNERDGGQTTTAAVVVDVDPKRKRVGIAERSYDADPVTGKWWYTWIPKYVNYTSICPERNQ